MWSDVAGKVKPSARHEVLCAWQPSHSGGAWNYDVLVHWPDGVWTDTMENEVEADEMPTYWQEIQKPAWKAPNVQLKGLADSGRSPLLDSPS